MKGLSSFFPPTQSPGAPCPTPRLWESPSWGDLLKALRWSTLSPISHKRLCSLFPSFSPSVWYGLLNLKWSHMTPLSTAALTCWILGSRGCDWRDTAKDKVVRCWAHPVQLSIRSAEGQQLSNLMTTSIIWVKTLNFKYLFTFSVNIKAQGIRQNNPWNTVLICLICPHPNILQLLQNELW